MMWPTAKINSSVRVGERYIGDDEPVFVIAEIGINHNGSLELARKLIDGAMFAGCDAVKFQKRTPELCVPPDQWQLKRDTPWGQLSYIDYRRRMEFDAAEFAQIDRHCRQTGIMWFASCWDEEAVDFIRQFDPPLFKAASASLTDHRLLQKMRSTGKPLMVSTGMSGMAEIRTAIEQLGTEALLMAHATSAYPCQLDELNLRMLHTLQDEFAGVPIGYSGHEVGLAPTWAAVALGACFIERHLTLDRSMWGSDQAASVEVLGMHNLVRNIRDIEQSMGDGVKQVYPSEMAALKKLRRINDHNGRQANHDNCRPPTPAEAYRFLYGHVLNPDPFPKTWLPDPEVDPSRPDGQS
jgi:N-acetylneuraminate synthase